MEKRLKLKEKTMVRKRITKEEGIKLLHEADFMTLGESANKIREEFHPEKIVTFVVDRNINYTNICISRCRFCAFYGDEDDPDAYILSKDEIFKKIDETITLGGTQILMQGVLHPTLPIEFFEDLFSSIKQRYNIQIHSLSPPEIYHIAKISALNIPQTLRRLKSAGLDSIPGGGAEILVDRVRGEISPKKIGWEQWTEVMIETHKLGMPTTATMMFGSVETGEEIIEHLIRIRELQDKTGGFTAFIPWTYQPNRTELGGRSATGVEYLKVLAISRIILDNIRNIQASWVTQGAKMAQIALKFGANDFGSTMLEENVVAATGVSYRMTKEEIIDVIRDAGYTPAQRDTVYNILRIY